MPASTPQERCQAKIDAIIQYCMDVPYAYGTWCIDTDTYCILDGFHPDHSITPVMAVAQLTRYIELWNN